MSFTLDSVSNSFGYVESILLFLLCCHETCPKNIGNVAILPLLETKHFILY